MCGFVGAIARHGNSLNDGIQRFVEASRLHTNTCSRGPDFNHLTKHKTLHLIHFRLKIMDLSDASNQPYENDRHILVYNGEIYNYKELARRFDYTEEFLGDTQFLFKFLASEGATAIHLLRGMFAFAFIDKQTGEVLLARDQFGQKPLYFTEKNNTVIFASRAEYLAELHSNQLSEDGLRQFKVLQSYVGPTTLYKNVYQVEPGTFLLFQRSGRKYKTRYWKPSFENSQPSKSFLEDLSNLVEKSVDRTLLSDVDVACTASGGLDSSLVAAIASKGVKNLQAYHGRFAENASYDESFYALSQARFSQFNLNIIELDSTQFEEDLLPTISSLGMVSSGPGSVNQYRVAKSISQSHKVYLSGQGGDEIFGGYARYFSKSTNPKLTKILLGYENLVRRASHHSDPLTSYLNVIRRSFGTGAYPNDTDHADTLNEIEKLFDETQLDLGQIPYERLGMYFDQIVTLPNLLSVEDSISMIHGIEGRYPLLDLDLVNFMNSLDAKYLFENGPKSLLSMATSRHICPEILARTDKMGFPLPLKSWGDEGKIPVFYSYLENNSQGAEHRDVWGQASLAILKSLRGIK